MKKLLVLVAGLGLAACATTPSNSPSYSQAVPELTAGTRDPAADVGVDVIRENGPRINLDKCGGRDGQAVMYREYGQLYIRITNMDCAYFKTSLMVDEEKLDGSQGNFGKTFRVDEDKPGWHELTLGSKKYFNHPEPGSKADVVRFYVPARTVSLDLYGDGRAPRQSIPYCGGTIEGKVNGGNVSLVFRDVQDCSALRISKGSEYKDYTLQSQGSGLGGSFNVPRDMVDLGANTVSVYLSGPRKEARIQASFAGGLR